MFVLTFFVNLDRSGVTGVLSDYGCCDNDADRARAGMRVFKSFVDGRTGVGLDCSGVDRRAVCHAFGCDGLNHTAAAGALAAMARTG